MEENRKRVRAFVKECTKSQFEKVLAEARLTEEQTEIVRLVSYGHSVLNTSILLHVSESTVARTMKRFYNRVGKMLQ